MKNQINLNLSKRNRRAIVYLSAILLFIIYSPRIYFYLKEEDKISIQSFPSEKWIKENNEKKYFNNYRPKANNIKIEKFRTGHNMDRMEIPETEGEIEQNLYQDGS